jgi:hypothetical protein
MLGQQLAPPGEHFFPEDEIRLSPSEVRLPPIQGLLLHLKVLLGEGGIAGLALELLLSLLQPLHSLDLLGPLGFQSLVQGAQLSLVLCCEGLPAPAGSRPPPSWSPSSPFGTPPAPWCTPYEGPSCTPCCNTQVFIFRSTTSMDLST